MIYLMIGVFIYAWGFGAMFVAHATAIKSMQYMPKRPHLWAFNRASVWPYDVVRTIVAALRRKK